LPILKEENYARMKGRPLAIVFCLVSLAAAGFLAAQQVVPPTTRMQRGIDLYGEGRWGEAIVELRRVQVESADHQIRGEAAFWIAMADLNAANYQEALHDLDEIGRIDPGSIRRFEISYHKARALYFLGSFDEAFFLFRTYSDSIRTDGRYMNDVRVGSWYSDGLYNDINGDYDRKAAAIFWMGECLYALANYPRAEEAYLIVVEQYTKSHKYEAAVNRLALIRQKKTEQELLEILRWKGQENVQTVQVPPSFQLTMPPATNSYDDAIIAYQERIAPYMTESTYQETMQTGVPQEPQTPQGSPPRVATSSQSSQTIIQQVPPAVIQQAPTADHIIRLLAIKASALEIMDRLITTLNTYEVLDYGYGYSYDENGAAYGNYESW
jgi:tetratricopeptide (TPR) repeat protein